MQYAATVVIHILSKIRYVDLFASNLFFLCIRKPPCLMLTSLAFSAIEKIVLDAVFSIAVADLWFSTVAR
jgi:hypothetical protein